ncbi:alpha-amylase family protein [Pedobacter sp.]|jgi:glycosidase|uniref:alpha-amylase family protein n=1 Tax=Pedobacter sp. TaxID=1411316 RepID=UPI002C0DBADF|nr:alpha-amylase family protein [Pedobacter sp.]HWW42588.1 alpha-amylase family protein [Pedobacter sp.]
MRVILKNLIIVILVLSGTARTSFAQKTDRPVNVHMDQKKIVIYQLLPRLFGNMGTANVPYGTIAQNGSGKFDDINDKALTGIKELGVNYVWYTGVIAHASLTDYSAFGIQPDDADVVKGRAGSPYAIRDYYDVDPDLAKDVKNRMGEFEALVKRTHQQGLKVIIDFVPNHVARRYHSPVKPTGAIDFGAYDDVRKAFSAANDFYYIPGQALVVPASADTITTALSPLMDHKFKEDPAKATGNNVFSASPKADDWYETVKLNYGVDYQGEMKAHFSPLPPVWTKMKAILLYWAAKGVDGFRCDMAEMVPVAFWNWVIPEVKKAYPQIVFIGEAYDPRTYETYFNEGKFDYLYDKVGLYDGLKKLIRNESSADVSVIPAARKLGNSAYENRMLRFLENHDEERIASAGFAGQPEYALPAMVVSATLGGGPVMLYFGQEVGEPGKGKEGFGGDDNRTTIFDYWGVPEHQKWMNHGAFDGALLNTEQVKLRAFYQKLMQISIGSEAISKGGFYEVQLKGNGNNRMYGYIRYTDKQRLLVLVNFDRMQSLQTRIDIQQDILNKKPVLTAKDLLSGQVVVPVSGTSVEVKVEPVSAQIIEF